MKKMAPVRSFEIIIASTKVMVLKAAAMTITIFWDVGPYSLVRRYHRFGGI
jgi:hypothetical protein